MSQLTQFSPEQRRVLIEIFLASSQVTFGVTFATLIFPPLDQTKQLAILVSALITSIFWIAAFVLARKARKI